MKIRVNGQIISTDDQWIYDIYGVEATSPGKINNLLSQVDENEEVEVLINSPGGSVFAGSEIFTALKSHKGNVVVKIVGIAASAASVIAMGGDKILMSPTGQLMIHNAATGPVYGDHRDMEQSADILRGINESISNAYILKTKLPQEELLNLMDNETFFTAQRALENKFIDEIMFQTGGFTNDISNQQGVLPIEVIQKMRSLGPQNFINKPEVTEPKPREPEKPNNNGVLLAKAKLKLQLNII